jgi:hypothetical protein
VENNVGSDEFAFSNTFDVEVFIALHQMQLLDGVPLKYCKSYLQHYSEDFYSPCSLEDHENNAHCQKKANQAICGITDASIYFQHSTKPLKLL